MCHIKVPRNFHQPRIAILCNQMKDRLDIILRDFIFMSSTGDYMSIFSAHHKQRYQM